MNKTGRVCFLGLKMPNVEIEQAEEKDRWEVVVPVSLRPLLSDGSGGVEEGPLHEIGLVGDLHFNDEGPPVLGVTIHVVSDFPLLLGQAGLLALADVDVLDVEPEDLVERTDNELFLAGILEDLLESEIDHRVDVENLLIVSHMFSVGPGMVCPSRGAKMRKETMQLSKIRIFNFRRFKE